MTDTIRILIASPGDVSDERKAVRAAIEEVARDTRVDLAPWSWDDGTHTFDGGAEAQRQIPAPETFDLVICLFGWRLGTPLAKTFDDALRYWCDGEPPTGTQYEYLRASDPVYRRSREDNLAIARPFLLLYSLDEELAFNRIPFDGTIPGKRPADLAQYGELVSFLRKCVGPTRIKGWFGDAGSLRTRVRGDLTNYLRDIGRIPEVWTKGNPYVGLMPMDEAHSGVFIGREDEIEQGIAAIVGALAVAPQPPAFHLITGPSGVGKSSLARAGLAAKFRAARQGGHVWRVLVVKPSELGPAPATGLLQRLIPDLPGLAGRAIDLAAATGSEAAGRAKSELAHALDAIMPDGALLLIVDQLEEALLPQDRERYRPLVAALDLLARSGRAVVAATLAGNHRDELTRHPLLAALAAAHRATELEEFGEPQLRRLITEPMQAAGGQASTALVDALIDECHTIRRGGRGILPLLQLALHDAYCNAAAGAGVGPERPTPPGLTLERGHFTGLDATVERLGAAALAASGLAEIAEPVEVHRLFRHLVRIDPELGEVARTVPQADLPVELAGVAATLSAPAHRLLVVDAAGFSLPHIELLRRWSRGVAWLGQERRLLAVRDRLLGDAYLWQRETDPAEKRRHLNISEALIDEAMLLRKTWPEADLGEALCAFLDEALAEVEGRRCEQMALRRSRAEMAARFLAERSEHIRSSNPHSAVLIALEALPRGDMIEAAQDAPLVAEAGTALCRALAADRLRLIFRGHEDSWFWSSLFDPAGQRIVTACTDGTARIWNATTGVERGVLRGHKGPVISAAFDPTGERIVTASEDRTARVWDAATGIECAVLSGHQDLVVSAAFDPTGERIVTASRDRTARIWDAATGIECAVLSGHEGRVRSAAFDPAGGRIVTASDDRTARIWAAVTGIESAVLGGHHGGVNSAVFDPAGKRIVTASDDGTARIWDVASGIESVVLRGHQTVESAAFDPAGERIVTASWDRTARIWDAATGVELAVLQGHEDSVNSAAFDPSGARIVTASGDATARIWDATTVIEHYVLHGHEQEVTSVAFDPKGKRILTASLDGTARIWDAATGIERARLDGHEDGVNSAAFDPAGERIVTASLDRTARIWDAATGIEHCVLRGHEQEVNSAAFDPKGERIVTASNDRTARIWDGLTGIEHVVLRGHEYIVCSAAFDPAGERVVTASPDGTARIWDAATGSERVVLREHGSSSTDRGSVTSAAFDSSGQRIVTASYDGTVRIWDAATGIERAVVPADIVTLLAAAFDPAGERIVTASADRTARVWDGGLPSLPETIGLAWLTRCRELTPAERAELHLPRRDMPTPADAVAHAAAHLAAGLRGEGRPGDALLRLALAVELYRAAGDRNQANRAREKRAALAWQISPKEAAEVYSRLVSELYTLGLSLP